MYSQTVIELSQLIDLGMITVDDIKDATVKQEVINYRAGLPA